MNRRDALMALGGAGLVAVGFPTLIRSLPKGERIESLQFRSMADIAFFSEAITGIKCCFGGLYFLPNLVTADGLSIMWDIVPTLLPGRFRVKFVNSDVTIEGSIHA